ncbi:MAG: hypothetical protein IPH93_16635 [Saprospiraceae bacterium]|nr:hypothetical protein [Saprospiraceae bacterium]
MASQFTVPNTARYKAYAEGCLNNQTSGNQPTPPQNPESTTLRVKKGQKIYFRLHVKEDDNNPEVGWNPEVRYSSISGAFIDPNERDPVGITPHKSKYSESFILNSKSYTIVPNSNTAQSAVSIDWEDFVIGQNTDEVTFKVIKVNISNDPNQPDTEELLFHQFVPAYSGSRSYL